MGLKEELNHRVLVGDGAMGTLLYQEGIEGCFEELNTSAPDTIEQVHRRYINAGADVIQTNTYAANHVKLRRYQQEHRVRELNEQAVKIARQAAGKNAFVVGTIGGIKAFFLTEDSEEEMKASLAEQVDVLSQTDVDGFLLETFYDLDEILFVIRKIRQVSDKPIIANLTMGDIGVMQGGIPVKDALTACEEAGADIVGLNCRMGPYHMLQSIEQVPLTEGRRLSIYPNASLPNVRDGRFFYQSNPGYFKRMTRSLVQEGARLIGGCCGTAEEHIRAIRQAVDDGKLVPIESKKDVTPAPQLKAVEPEKRPKPLPDIVKEKTSVIVELDPPKSLALIPKFMEGVEALTDAGADAVTLADNSLAVSRVDNFALGMRMKQEKNARPLLHMACRDRNIIGMQSHLLGLHTAGIHDILTITGDPAKVGDFPGATSVYDMASMDLMRLVKQLNEGMSFSGKDIGEKTAFSVGAAFNANARRIDREVKRLEMKVEAGADYFMSQPVYDPERFKEIHEATKHLNVPIYMGIMPLVSSRNAEFLHYEVPGISLTDDVRERMARLDGDKEASAREGIALSKYLLDAALPYFNGIYLITPFLRYELTAELTRYVHEVSVSLEQEGRSL